MWWRCASWTAQAAAPSPVSRSWSVLGTGCHPLMPAATSHLLPPARTCRAAGSACHHASTCLHAPATHCTPTGNPWARPADTVAGLDWVAANHKKPAVVTLSLGIQVGSWSRVLEDAVRNLALQHNVTVRRGLGRRTGHAVRGCKALLLWSDKSKQGTGLHWGCVWRA